MKTCKRWLGNRGRQASLVLLTMAVGFGACTSSRDSPALETPGPQRTLSTTPTVEDMNEQASGINQKKNIEDRRPNAAANETPAVRSQKILPGRQPVAPDTIKRQPLPPRIGTEGGEQ